MEFNVSEQQQAMIEGISNIRIVAGNVLVTAVYQGPKETDETTSDDESDRNQIDVNKLSPGQVKINFQGNHDDGDNDESAWVIGPYGHRPTTSDSQKTQNLEPFSMNQSFGFFAMPRVGDKVFVIGTASDDNEITPSMFYMFGSRFSTGVHRPPLTDVEDVQTLHRSGASIRFNDTFAGGGSIDTNGTESKGFMKGLTGNVTITGNRTMILSGSKYLPHGLLAKYGDPRSSFTKAEIDASSKVGTYSSLFSNEEGPDKYHDPFTTDLIDNNFFLSPPSTTDDIIPLTNNSLLMLQHGGGVMRIDDHDTEPGYSRMTMSAASMTTLIGKDYQGVGLKGDSNSPEGYDDASGINEGTDEFAIYHIQGARFKVYAVGDVDVWAAPGRDITIKSADGEGKVYLGEGTKAVFRDGDETTTNKAQTSFCGVPESHMDCIGIPHGHTHKGHSHEGVERQSKTYA